MGIGADGSYGMLKANEANITEIQMSLLGEFRAGSLSFGLKFIPFSNYKAVTGNLENSLNGMGFGVLAGYNFTPNVRMVFDYNIINYKLDPATVNLSDMRLGAGFYF